jgi:membrane-associated phospholipid phosphatase
MRLLMYLTNFGDPYLTVPLAGLVLAWLAITCSWRSLVMWSGGFGIAASIVAASRFAHVFWGLGVPEFNFAVVSGHTMLASAVYPTALSLCVSRIRKRTVIGPYISGLAFAGAIGVSRILIGYHSTSEVLCGLLSGSLVAALTCIQMLSSQMRSSTTNGLAQRDPTPFAAAALAAVVMYHGKIAPVSAWIDRSSTELSQLSKIQDGRIRWGHAATHCRGNDAALVLHYLSPS